MFVVVTDCGINHVELLKLGVWHHRKKNYKSSASNSLPTHSRLKTLLYLIDGTDNSYHDGSMKELLSPNQAEKFVRQQQRYLLNRLHEVKKQRHPSTTDTETSNMFSLHSSCYGSNVDIESSLPEQISFIGDFCQGGFPKKSDELLSTEFDEVMTSSTSKQYGNSKSTFVSSQDTPSISPRVSDLNISIENYPNKTHCPKCNHRCSHSSRHSKRPRSSASITRAVRFKEPESTVASHTEEEVEQTSCQHYTTNSSSNKDSSNDDRNNNTSAKSMCVSFKQHSTTSNNSKLL